MNVETAERWGAERHGFPAWVGDFEREITTGRDGCSQQPISLPGRVMWFWCRRCDARIDPMDIGPEHEATCPRCGWDGSPRIDDQWALRRRLGR